MQLRRALLLGLGILSIVSPRRVLALQARVNTIGYDGSGDLEPRRWLVTLTRVAGVIAVVLAMVATDGDPPDSEDRYV
ncbi:MAG: hypothetical protein ABEJ57_05055 [Halobacteriaceae archaeon]